ncbi:MAG: hypothetical protein ACR2OJ_00435 [Hyphomicrobiales bacterium]
MNIPYVEVDALYWKPGWTEPGDEEFFANLQEALTGENWVLDGNYNRTQRIKWQRVEQIVWLNLPMWQITLQLISRTIRRCYTKEELWAGNRESWRKSFLSRDSVILWSWKNFKTVRDRYFKLAQDPAFGHIDFVILRSRRDAEKFVSSLRNSSNTA